MDFSVLMTTYDGEKEEYLDASLKSILVEQSVLPSQLVLVLDGPVRQQLEDVVNKYVALFPDRIDVVRCEKNMGQSKASAEGMRHVRFDIVARMDSDDISLPDRFEKELAVLEEHKDISVVGGWICEFQTEPGDSDLLRVVPETHEEIAKMFPKRMPINNVTSMIRKDALEAVGGYGRDTVNEDYSVYCHMWAEGKRFYNIQSVLGMVRIGNGMVKRRNDWRIYRDWKKDMRYLREKGMISRGTAFFSNMRCFLFILTPAWVKAFLYKTVLRKKSKRT